MTILAAGALLMLAVRRWTLPAVALPAFGLAALSALWTNAPPPAPGTPLVRVVQPDIGQEDRSETDGERVLTALEKLSGQGGATPRLVVWPEGVVRDYVEDGYPFYAYGWSSPLYLRRRMARLLGPEDILLIGGTALEFNRDQISGAANSVFALDAQARLRGRYDKAHLVPYGEYLPMPWLLKPLGLARLVPRRHRFHLWQGPCEPDAAGLRLDRYADLLRDHFLG
ncbi:nitrilase-related carbon-nitrogen hydrolase [Sphingomonas sp. H160509]|uniref:nitrilase-related carbon-nitrogen hydrolase n=1 Tax=Sphingomonas sp. H160509 TaxID=2955313 RepID=UPI003158AA35